MRIVEEKHGRRRRVVHVDDETGEENPLVIEGRDEQLVFPQVAHTLSREEVEQLVLYLRGWLETGSLSE